MIDMTERKKRMWELRCGGWTYQAIADEFGANRERVRQIVLEVERRMERACNEYSWSVTDPIVYGVWHIFTHDGRVSGA